MLFRSGMAYRCVNDFNRTMKYVSAGCKWLTDYSPFELIDNSKKAYMDMIHEDDREDVNHQIQSSLSSGRPFQMEYRIITASGQKKWVWEEGLGIIADDGTVAEVEGFISDMTEHKLEEQQLRKENKRLKSTIKERYKFGDIIGKNRSMQDVYAHISMAAASAANVIIYGESGTGKELVAREIHKLSDQHDRPFVPVNCSAIPENLFESEFFGYKKGAFTGANLDKPGYFDQANGGTLFLDELGEIDLTGQVKLLRVLDGGGYTPVGSSEVKKAEVRIVAATNRNLGEQVKLGNFREDLYYRIQGFLIHLPPLRERGEDKVVLAQYVLNKISKAENLPLKGFSPAAIAVIKSYDWPGNVRELENTIEYAIAMTNSATLKEDLILQTKNCKDEFLTLQEARAKFEKKYLQNLLKITSGNVSKTAELSGKYRADMYNLMKKHGITPRDFKP